MRFPASDVVLGGHGDGAMMSWCGMAWGERESQREGKRGGDAWSGEELGFHAAASVLVIKGRRRGEAPWWCVAWRRRSATVALLETTARESKG